MPTKINRFGPSMSIEQILRTVGEVKQAHPEAFAPVKPTEKQRAQLNRWLDDQFQSKAKAVTLALALMLSTFVCSAVPATEAYAKATVARIAPAVEKDMVQAIGELAAVPGGLRITTVQYQLAVDAARNYTETELVKVALDFYDHPAFERRAAAVYRASLMGGVSGQMVALGWSKQLVAKMEKEREQHAKEIKAKDNALATLDLEDRRNVQLLAAAEAKVASLEAEVLKFTNRRTQGVIIFFVGILGLCSFLILRRRARSAVIPKKPLPYGVKPV